MSKIYAIADYETCLKNNIDVVDFVKAVTAGGVRIVQYRDKVRDVESVDREFGRLLRLVDPEVTLVINDHAGIAARYGAMLHLGQTDSYHPPAGPFGRSTHSISEVKQAIAENPQPDYIGFGAMFSSPTKPEIAENRNQVSEVLALWSKDIVLIGGINRETLPLLPTDERIYYAIISDFFALGNTPRDIEKRASGYGNP